VVAPQAVPVEVLVDPALAVRTTTPVSKVNQDGDHGLALIDQAIAKWVEAGSKTCILVAKPRVISAEHDPKYRFLEVL